MIQHANSSDVLIRTKIKRKEIVLAGNQKLRIYGLLQCKSGKRMKRENRVFFSSETEAVHQHFRPCGHCMKEKYQEWKLSKKK